jgi:hypothetical protein
MIEIEKLCQEGIRYIIPRASSKFIVLGQIAASLAVNVVKVLVQTGQRTRETKVMSETLCHFRRDSKLHTRQEVPDCVYTSGFYSLQEHLCNTFRVYYCVTNKDVAFLYFIDSHLYSHHYLPDASTFSRPLERNAHSIYTYRPTSEVEDYTYRTVREACIDILSCVTLVGFKKVYAL